MEEAAKYKIQYKNKCEVCGKPIIKSKCNDCIELEEKFATLKNTSEDRAIGWLKKQLNKIKE